MFASGRVHSNLIHLVFRLTRSIIFLSISPEQGSRLYEPSLVKNPLRLALLCSTWQGSDKGLPETKAELYQHFVAEFYNLS